MLQIFIFTIAVAYASVGHGGASGYLAILSLYGFSPLDMAPSALLLNILVAGTAFITYYRAGFFDKRIFWSFSLTSIPAALAGGIIHVSPGIYSWLLVSALLFAAFRLAISQTNRNVEEPLQPISMILALPCGAGIGLLSGIVGVGGGIFLSPLLLLMRWAKTKQTAAVSAGFILVNSMAGLYGHLTRKNVNMKELLPFVLAAFIGGIIGSHFGARRFDGVVLRRILAIIMLIASFKLLRLIHH